MNIRLNNHAMWITCSFTFPVSTRNVAKLPSLKGHGSLGLGRRWVRQLGTTIGIATKSGLDHKCDVWIWPVVPQFVMQLAQTYVNYCIRADISTFDTF